MGEEHHGTGWNDRDIARRDEDGYYYFVTRKKDGTGLGLWVSRSIVERYGGDLTAANRAEGGAVMTVSLLTEPAPDKP